MLWNSFLAERAIQKKCFIKIILDKEGAIQGGLILVDVGGDDLSLVEHCSVRSIASLFGLGTLSVADLKPYPSIANGPLNAVGLTEYDKRFLRLLYDPSIRSGMTQMEASPVLRSLVRAPAAK